MTGSPQGSSAAFDDTVIVVHPRLLVAETLCIALRGIGIDATQDRGAEARLALVETADSATIRALARSGTVVLALGSADPITVARALRAGALRHLGDEASFVEIAEEICTTVAEGPAATGLRQTFPEETTLLDALTKREQEVLRGLVSGNRAADIAEAHYVSITTVRNQIQSILTKLNAHSQLEAVSIAVRAGWTPLAA